jgi:RsiW-degrading membrane proteinase PrsW (M82 family)
MDLDLLVKAVTAMAPVLVLLLALDRLDIFNLISFRMIGLLVLTGGVVAGLSFLANWRVMDGFPIGFSAYSRYVAPLVEEPLKALPIIWLFAANRIGFKLDCAIAGFAVGAGFSMVENAWYLHVITDANYSAWLVRGFGTAVMHGGATAIFAAVSHEFSERQLEADATHYKLNPLIFAPGLGLAYVLHSAFNHFPEEPALAMALTLVFVPLTLFGIFSLSEGATKKWITTDRDMHRQVLSDIRSGRFAESESGRALKDVSSRFNAATAADVWRYLELKTELVLRNEELMLQIQDGQSPPLTSDDRDKVKRLEGLEESLGSGVLAAIAPKLRFSRNDLWELEGFKRRVNAQR